MLTSTIRGGGVVGAVMNVGVQVEVEVVVGMLRGGTQLHQQAKHYINPTPLNAEHRASQGKYACQPHLYHISALLCRAPGYHNGPKTFSKAMFGDAW
jgi:hypothetical protein